MHFSATLRELSRNSVVGPRGRAEGQQKARCLHILNEWDAFEKQRLCFCFLASQKTLGVRLGHQGYSDLASMAATPKPLVSFTFCATAARASATPGFRPYAFHR